MIINYNLWQSSDKAHCHRCEANVPPFSHRIMFTGYIPPVTSCLNLGKLFDLINFRQQLTSKFEPELFGQPNSSPTEE